MEDGQLGSPSQIKGRQRYKHFMSVKYMKHEDIKEIKWGNWKAETYQVHIAFLILQIWHAWILYNPIQVLRQDRR